MSIQALSSAIQRLIEHNNRRFPVNDNECPEERRLREMVGMSRAEFDRWIDRLAGK